MKLDRRLNACVGAFVAERKLHAYFHQVSFDSVTLELAETISQSLSSAGSIALALGSALLSRRRNDASLFESTNPMNSDSRFCSSIACDCRVVATW